MDVDYLLTATRSARKSLDLEAPVDRGEIRDCLRLACQAANGTNQQSWRWVVVFDPDLRAKIGEAYRDAFVAMTAGRLSDDGPPPETPFGRLMSSTRWLVDHIAEVPVHVIPCYRPYLADASNDGAFERATLYGSIFPAVWNFQLALHSRGYGTCITTMHLVREQQVGALLGIPDAYVQGCLLPVGRLKAGHHFTPAPRRPIEEVVVVDGWEGPPL